MLDSNLHIAHTNQNTTEYLSTDSPESLTKKSFFRGMTSSLSSTFKQDTQINRDITIDSNKDSLQKFGSMSSTLFASGKKTSSDSLGFSTNDKLENVLSLNEQSTVKTKSLSSKNISALRRLQVISEHLGPADDQREEHRIGDSSLEYPPEEVPDGDNTSPGKRVPKVSLGFQQSPFSINLPLGN